MSQFPNYVHAALTFYIMFEPQWRNVGWKLHSNTVKLCCLSNQSAHFFGLSKLSW